MQHLLIHHQPDWEGEQDTHFVLILRGSGTGELEMEGTEKEKEKSRGRQKGV